MREDTIGRKKASGLFQELRGRGWLLERMAQVISEGKRGLDGLALELGRMVAEAVMYLEREEIAGEQRIRHLPKEVFGGVVPGHAFPPRLL